MDIFPKEKNGDGLIINFAKQKNILQDHFWLKPNGKGKISRPKDSTKKDINHILKNSVGTEENCENKNLLEKFGRGYNIPTKEIMSNQVINLNTYLQNYFGFIHHNQTIKNMNFTLCSILQVCEANKYLVGY